MFREDLVTEHTDRMFLPEEAFGPVAVLAHRLISAAPQFLLQEINLASTEKQRPSRS